MAMGADYSFELISIERCAPQFIGYSKLILGSVLYERKVKSCKVFSVLFLVTYTFWPMRQQGRALKGTRGAGIQAELVVRRLHCTLPYTAPA